MGLVTSGSALDLGRLGGPRMCAETTYQSIYRSDGGGLGSDASELLTRRQFERRPRGWRGRHARTGPLAEAKPIGDRPSRWPSGHGQETAKLTC